MAGILAVFSHLSDLPWPPAFAGVTIYVEGICQLLVRLVLHAPLSIRPLLGCALHTRFAPKRVHFQLIHNNILNHPISLRQRHRPATYIRVLSSVKLFNILVILVFYRCLMAGSTQARSSPAVTVHPLRRRVRAKLHTVGHSAAGGHGVGPIHRSNHRNCISLAAAGLRLL